MAERTTGLPRPLTLFGCAIACAQGAGRGA